MLVAVAHSADGPQVATRVALLDYKPTYVLCTESDDYPRMLAERWAAGQPWINVEQDVVPWPGALEGLWNCDWPWCAYGYWERHPMMVDGTVALGCAKFSADFMAGTPYVWSDWPEARWQNCDNRLTEIGRASGFDVHQHFPPVTNANPKYLARGAYYNR